MNFAKPVIVTANWFQYALILMHWDDAGGSKGWGEGG